MSNKEMIPQHFLAVSRIAVSILVVTLCLSAVTFGSEPELRVLTGYVTDEGGHPLANALVEWATFGTRHEDRESVRTQKDGSFRLETRTYGADFRLGVSAEEWGPRWVENVVPDPIDNPKERNFRLLKPVEVRGQVVDDAGTPVVGAVVLARSESRGFHSSFSMPTPSYPFPGPPHEATTNENGMFVIRNLPNEKAAGFFTPQLSPNPAKDRPYYKFAISVRIGKDSTMPRGTAVPGEFATVRISRDYVTNTERSGVLKLRVFDQNSGDPITDFRVVRRHVAGVTSVSNSKGEYTLTGRTPGRNYQVFVYADDFAPFVVDEPAAQESSAKRIPCPMVKSPGFMGRLVDSNGDPVKGAKGVAGVARKNATDRFRWSNFEEYVDGHGSWQFVQRFTTDEDGRFSVCVGDEANSLAVMAPGFARRFIQPVNTPKPDADGVVTFPLEEGNSLRVRVIKEGRPQPNASLWLNQRGNWRMDFGSTRTDKMGEYEFVGLSEGVCSVSVYESTGSCGTSRLSRSVTLSAGITEITMDKPDGEFSLTGEAPPFMMITLRPKDEQLLPYTHVGTVADVNGRYRIEGLNNGAYELSTLQSPGVSGYMRSGRSSANVEISGDTVHDITRQSFPGLFWP